MSVYEDKSAGGGWAAEKDLSHVGRRACALSLQTSELEADKMRTVSKSAQAAGARRGRGGALAQQPRALSSFSEMYMSADPSRFPTRRATDCLCCR